MTGMSVCLSVCLPPLHSSKIDNAVSVGALSEAVEGFQELYALSNELAGSKCVQLLSFVGYWCEQRRLQLKERLTR